MIADFLIANVTAIIAAVGNLGIFILMFLESTMVPLPSELVMPFAGFLVGLGKMNLWLAIFASTLGSLAGSLFGYWIGYKFSNKIVKKFGRYLLLEVEHLKKAQKWFKKYGNKTIFISRFIPGIRHVISIPAGAGKMNLKKFSVLTILGAGIWNTFLLWLGYVLEKNWGAVYSYAEIVDIIVIIIIIALIAYYIFNIVNARKVKRLKK